jgi:starch-binding outer membrane protein, SusD/RagB family
MKIRILIIAIGLIITFGCDKFGNDFLEKAPGIDVTKDSIFKNIEYAEQFLWNAYATLPYNVNTADNAEGNKMGHSLMIALTDLNHCFMLWGGVANLYYTGNYNSSTENSSAGTKYHFMQDGAFPGIRKSHIFIENIVNVPGINPAYQRQLIAEARMIQAVHYSEMFHHYGGVLWLSKAYTVNDDFSELKRITAQATADSIVSLIDRAIPDLPWVITDRENWSGRFTKAAAMGLKARVLLFNASPIFNANEPFRDGEASDLKLTWHGSYDANRWKQAADAAQVLITQAESTGDYRIHSTGGVYRKDFQDAYYQRWSPEVLISIRKMFRSPNFSWNYTFHWSGGTWAAVKPTQNYVDMFPMANGLPITDPGSGYDPENPYLNRDPRLYESVLTNGDSYKGRTAELYIGGRERPSAGGGTARSGYTIRKFLLDLDQATSFQAIVHNPYLRLAEVYLIYAEAINEFNGGPTPEAYRCVNIVRNRVGLGDLPAGLSQVEFRESILVERALEFYIEEKRWFDLVRWKREEDLRKPLHGMDIRRSSTQPYTYTYTLTNMPPRYWQDNWDPKWYLSAFPVNEINKGYGLVQNPGW